MKLHLNRWILVAGTGIAVAGGAFAYTRFSTASDQVAAPQQVQVAKGNLQLSVTATGSLKPVAAKSADLSFRSSGVVEQVWVQVGDTVQKGQSVARLELRPLELSVNQSEISLRTAQLNYQGQVAAARPEDVVNAQAALENARLKLTNMETQGLPEDVAAASANLANAQAKLAALGNPAVADLLAAQATVESNKAQVKTAETNLISAQIKLKQLKNPLPADISTAESTLASARQKLELLKNPLASDVASAQSSVASASANYSNAQVALTNLKNPPADTVASAQATVRSAEASLANAQNALQSLQSQLTTDKRKQLVDAYAALIVARERLQDARDTNAPSDVVAPIEAEVTRLLRITIALETEANMPNAGVTAQQIVSAKASIQNAQSNLESQQLKLAKLLSPLATDVIALENSVASSKGSLDSAQAKLAQLLNPSPGDVAVAQANFDAANARYLQLRNPTPDDLQTQELAVAAAETSLNLAGANSLTAQARLVQLTSPTESEVAGATASLRSAEASLEKTRTPNKELDLALQRNAVTQAETTLSKTVQPGSVLDIARSQLSVDKSQIDLDTAKYNLDQGTLISPINGIVSKVNINPGASQGVGSSTVVMSIIDPSEMQVDISVDETDISKVDVNQRVQLTVEAAGTRPYQGTVIAVSPASTVTSGVTSYTVTIKVPDPKGLKAGMTATANVIYQSKQNVLLVPNRAIKTVNRERQVQVLVDGKAETRTVQVGLADDQRSEITSGLNEGDTVLIEAARGATSATTRVPAGAAAIPGAALGVGGGGAANFRPAGR